MRLVDNVRVLKVEGERGALFPALIWDDTEVVLVDACFPLQYPALREAIQKAGFAVSDITRIILTHQDIDHIGCVKEVAAASGAKVAAHELEAPYIDGRKTPIKLEALEKVYDTLPEKSQSWYHIAKEGYASRRFPIDEPLRGGKVLPIGSGIDVIHTPGHTPGHICLYVRDRKALIAGDGMILDGETLRGPNPIYTQDMEQGIKSLAQLKDYAVKSVVCYHGGLFKGDFQAALKRILSEAV